MGCIRILDEEPTPKERPKILKARNEAAPGFMKSAPAPFVARKKGNHLFHAVFQKSPRQACILIRQLENQAGRTP
jgi:hypothetical protein